MSFKSDYRDLLIKQYWDKPKARAEIELQAGTWSRAFDWLKSFISEFDLDLATGARLDIIGRIVGQPRLIPNALARVFFGFADNPNAGTFNNKEGTVVGAAPFKDKWERAYTTYELNDNQYRLFLRAKIVRNTAGPQLPNINAAISTLFDGAAYVVDNNDMRLTLHVSPLYDEQTLIAILRSDLLPKPAGVSYDTIIKSAPGETFGFADNDNAQPFASKFDLVAEPGGRFAIKYFLT
jgi:hypothetical protein